MKVGDLVKYRSRQYGGQDFGIAIVLNLNWAKSGKVEVVWLKDLSYWSIEIAEYLEVINESR